MLNIISENVGNATIGGHSFKHRIKKIFWVGGNMHSKVEACRGLSVLWCKVKAYQISCMS